ncbi:MAG: hypothetical protein A2293_02255 [Elusimicrobia bacterium RIFOXYB2_FULL_49_7]|nr:MAG: hypothetical protein A2293_02255 [Elusimicrobia bacterium RIFOXYB2_FULL_49_7]
MNLPTLPRLKQTLLTLTQWYGDFQALLVLEQEKIVSSDTQALAGIVHQKEEMALRIQGAEEERLALFAESARILGLPETALKLDRIALMLPAQEAQELLVLRRGLQTAVTQAKALNEVNTQLLKDAVAYVQTAFELVTGKRNVTSGYGRLGKTTSEVRVRRNLVNTTV